MALPVSASAPDTNMSKQLAISDSYSSQMRHSYMGKEPMMPMVSTKRKELGLPRSIQIRDPVSDTRNLSIPKQKVSHNHVLITPKDEPYTDGMPLDGTPMIAMNQLDQNASAAQNVSIFKPTYLGHTVWDDTTGDGRCTGNNFAASILKPQIPRPLQFSSAIEQEYTNDGSENEQVTYSRELMVVPEPQFSSDDFRSLANFSDICKGEEDVEIQWINVINNEFPPSFNYIPRSLVFQNAVVNFTLSKIKAGSCCPECYGDCLSSPSTCICAAEGDHKFAYTVEGLLKEDFLEDRISETRDPQGLSYCIDCPLERWKSDDMLEPCKGHLRRKFIRECWTKCGCHKRCGNRVVQRGIQCKLELFFTVEEKKWGLRTQQKLSKGAFVCEYAGEILTCKEWCERAKQENSSTLTKRMNQPVPLDAFWCLEDNMMDEEALCLDSTYFGNVARFINHRCFDANLIEIPVKIETPEHHYYHLAFFTTREVDALEELTWDYGINFDDNDLVKAFCCRCGSKFCRNIKRGRRLRSASS